MKRSGDCPYKLNDIRKIILLKFFQVLFRLMQSENVVLEKVIIHFISSLTIPQKSTCKRISTYSLLADSTAMQEKVTHS